MKLLYEQVEGAPVQPAAPSHLWGKMWIYVRSRLTDAGIFWISYLLFLILAAVAIRAIFF